jgi:hypothetical protein
MTLISRMILEPFNEYGRITSPLQNGDSDPEFNSRLIDNAIY